MNKPEFVEYQEMPGGRWRKAKIAEVALTISPPSVTCGVSQDYLISTQGDDGDRLFLEWTGTGSEIEIYDIRYPDCPSYREQREEMAQHSCDAPGR